MPVWMDAVGVMCIGAVQGYLFIYILRRVLPPIILKPDWFGKTSAFTVLAAVGVSGFIGASSAILPQGSMIGPYGIGLLTGLVANTGLVIWIDKHR